MDTMFRSNGHTAGFEMMEKNTNHQTLAAGEMELLPKQGGKGIE